MLNGGDPVDNETDEPIIAIAGAEQADEPISAVFARLVDSGRAYASAEIERNRQRAALIGTGARDAAILLGIALVLAFGALVALLVGLIMILTPLLSIAGATAAVVGGALLLVVILALLAKRRIGRMMAATRS